MQNGVNWCLQAEQLQSLGCSSPISHVSLDCLHSPGSVQSPTVHCSQSASPFCTGVALCNISSPQFYPMHSKAVGTMAGNAPGQVHRPCDVQKDDLESAMPQHDTLEGHTYVESVVGRCTNVPHMPTLPCPIMGQHTVPGLNTRRRDPASSHAVYTKSCDGNENMNIVANVMSLPDEDLAAFQVHTVMSTCVHLQRSSACASCILL